MSYPPLGYPPPGGYGQQPHAGFYPSPAGYPYGPPPPVGGPNGNNTWKWVLAAIGLLALVALVATGLWLGSTSRSTLTVAQTTTHQRTTTTTRPTSSRSTTTTVTSTTATSTGQAAPGDCNGIARQPGPQTPAGWQPVPGPRHLAYDVPSQWNVLGCTSLVGWEKPCPEGPFGYCPIRMMSGAAELPGSECPKESRAVTGLPGDTSTDIDQSVRSEAQLVEEIYTSHSGHVPTVSLSRPRRLTVSGAPAVQIIATVTNIEADLCTGPAALHSMIATAVPGQDGTVLFVVSLQQGYPGAPDRGLIDQLVATLRRV